MISTFLGELVIGSLHLQSQILKRFDGVERVVRVSLEIAKLDFDIIFGFLEVAATLSFPGTVC
jgi:hypothetical protein